MDIAWILDIVKNVVIALIIVFVGEYAFTKYMLPKLLPRMIADSIKNARDLPEVNNLIAKANNLLDQATPFIEKVKAFDFDKIDPVAINDLIKTVKELAETFKASMQKPEIPPPTKK